jgi:hypothetical protein
LGKLKTKNFTHMSQTILVRIGKTPVVVTPHTPVVEKNNRKQFWFYHEGKAKLAVYGKAGWTA